MKILMILIIALSISSILFCQSSIVYDSGTTIDIGAGANISADNITVNGTFSGSGTFNNGGPLPVELVSFSAAIVNNRVELTWETATEINNYGFSVERFSESPKNIEIGDYVDMWQTLGFVNGSGNSNSPKQYSYLDENPPPAKLKYRLKQIDTDGRYEYYHIMPEVDASSITSVSDGNAPKEFALFQNYPNPFNPTTIIKFTVASDVRYETQDLKLAVYDILGKELAVLVNQKFQPGNHEVSFDAANFSSGVYFYTISSRGFIQTKKMILFR